MKFLLAILDALVSFVQRNPLLCLLIVILAVGAPAVLKGIAVFFLYFILGLVVLGIALMLFFRWKISSMRRQMGDQFNQQFGGRGGFGAPFGEAQQQQTTQEGDVKVYATNETPEKRVSKNVGDYVEFEETKEKE